MDINSYRNHIFYTVLAVILLCFGSILVMAYLDARDYLAYLQTQKKYVTQVTQNTAQKISQTVTQLETIVNETAAKLSKGELDTDHESLVNALQNITGKSVYINGTGIAYLPYAHDKKNKLYSPYVIQKNDSFIIKELSDFYDYSQSLNSSDKKNLDLDIGWDTQWFHKAIKGEKNWGEPYYGKISNSFIQRYSVPFFRPGKTEEGPIGVLYITLDLKYVRNILNNFDFGKTGYGYIVSENGKIIAHPVSNVLGQPIEKYVKNYHDQNLAQSINQKISQNDSFSVAYDTQSSSKLWLLTNKIPHSTWTLVTVFNVQEMTGEKIFQYIPQFKIFAILLLIALTGICILFLRLPDKNIIHWAELDIAFSIICILLSIAYGVTTSKYKFDPSVIPLTSESMVYNYLENSAYLRNLQNQPYTLIPTGMYIQYLKFPSFAETQVTGYIWCKYPLNSSLNKDYIFPQQSDKLFTRLEYVKKEPSHETYGWHFVTSFLHISDNILYPFDQQTIKIRIWSKDFYRNVLPIPDLDAYDFTKPQSLPGISHVLQLKHWDFKASFFSFEQISYYQNFGITSYLNRYNVPVLTFNVVLSRKLVEPIVRYFLPLFLVAMLVYIGLSIPADKIKTSTLGVLSFSTSLLFVLTIAHVALRQELQTYYVTYIEYCYIAMYVMTVLAAINSLLIISESRINFITYHNNLLPKLLYWPVLFLFIFVLTLCLF